MPVGVFLARGRTQPQATALSRVLLLLLLPLLLSQAPVPAVACRRLLERGHLQPTERLATSVAAVTKVGSWGGGLWGALGLPPRWPRAFLWRPPTRPRQHDWTG